MPGKIPDDILQTAMELYGCVTFHDDDDDPTPGPLRIAFALLHERQQTEARCRREMLPPPPEQGQEQVHD